MDSEAANCSDVITRDVVFTFRTRSKDAPRNTNAIPSEPRDVCVNAEALDRLFGVSVAPEYILFSASITRMTSTLPAPTMFTLDTSQTGKMEIARMRYGAATVYLKPYEQWSGEVSIYRLPKDDMNAIEENAKVCFSREATNLRCFNKTLWIAPVNSVIGAIFSKEKNNGTDGIRLIQTPENEELFKIDESVVSSVLEKYESARLFAMTGTLRRADRIGTDPRSFSDFSDVVINSPNIVRLDICATNTVSITVRCTLVKSTHLTVPGQLTKRAR